MFPSLVNCCTLIWFSKWPIEALTSVANQYLKQTREIPKEALVNLFPKIHSSVEAAAEKFF
jgi:dynein heavy chain